MSEKIFKGPADFAEYFKGNPDMLVTIPWGNHICNSVESINKGCSCRKKKRKNNADKIYLDIIKNVFKNNRNVCSILKKSLQVKRLVFELDGKIILELNDE